MFSVIKLDKTQTFQGMLAFQHLQDSLRCCKMVLALFCLIPSGIMSNISCITAARNSKSKWDSTRCLVTVLATPLEWRPAEIIEIEGCCLNFSLHCKKCNCSNKVLLLIQSLTKKKKATHTFKLPGQQISQPSLQQRSDPPHKEQPHSPARSPETTTWALAHRTLSKTRS